MKYNYSKEHIKTADDFIERIASKSSITRRKYTIRCGTVQIMAEQWLQEGLASHRIAVEHQSNRTEE